jgi:flavin reductase (DIM6/NTAB) family NADH-FMN oxidoreductase RutF
MSARVFKLIGKDWMLITAGDEGDFNSMTASWGGLGFLWGRPVSFIFVRPQRFTFEFVERSTHYTLSFFDETYRDALNYFGTHSGRDVDKVAQTGLTPVAGKTGAVYFAEARLVLECKTLYGQDLVEQSFWEHEICEQAYKAGDYHRMYVGEVVRILQR